MSEVHDLTAVELAGKIRSKEISPKEVVDAALARIEACKELNAFVTVAAEEAIRAAADAERVVMKGGALPPLAGIPYSVKDVTSCQGIETTYGSSAMPAFVPDADNLAVARARAAGAILLGKTTTPELAHKIHTYAPVSGLTLNPYSPDVTCGGSSGGAAVAVAAGMGPISLGTDGGGSVRIPASCCGVVGLKPTIGSIPDPQAQDLFGVTAHVGPLARTVADTRLFYEVVQGGHRHDPYSQGPRPAPRSCATLQGVRVAWMPRCGNMDVDTEVAALTHAAVKRMEAMGAVVDEISLDFASLEPHFLVLMESRVVRILRKYVEAGVPGIDPTLLAHYQSGLHYTAVDYMDALSERAATFKNVQDVLQNYDVIASPTVSAPPLPHTQDPHGPVMINGAATGRVRAEWYPYTLGFNLTGHPGISIPCGYTKSGLPVGFQLAGRWYDEHYLLDVAERLEEDLAVPRKAF